MGEQSAEGEGEVMRQECLVEWLNGYDLSFRASVPIHSTRSVPLSQANTRATV